MNIDDLSADILVVGAGISGLMAAETLNAQGLRVLVVDKQPEAGGRLATHTMQGGTADLGAQFFTARSPEFQSWVEDWIDAGLVFQWTTGFSNGSLDTDPLPSGGSPRYAVRGGMSALAEHLVEGLQIRLGVELESLTPGLHGWWARSTQGRLYKSQAVILTAPVPRSLELLDAGRVHLSPGERADLESLRYAPCVAGLFCLDQPLHLPEPGALQRADHPIPWIADNRRKGLSPETTLITVHAGPDTSRAMWKAADSQALETLQQALEPFMESGTQVLEAHLRRWRFASPELLYSRRFMLAAYLPPLVFAGDAFGGPRVEGAALSGLAAGQAILQSLERKKW